MKFHSIEIENITSLKGYHKIDFDNLLQSESLLAITGPTGSGKSSILTSISLALFGKNYKTTLSSADFVTLDQEKGSVILNFSVGLKKYKATWSCKVRKKSGELIKRPTPSRNIFFNEEALETNAEDIIGLNFDQFSKTVILNQGEFSRFLTSTFKDRKDILEKLYNGEQLSHLNEILKNKLKEASRKKELLDSKIDNSLPFTEELFNDYEIELKNLNIDLEKSRSNENNLAHLIKKIEDSIEISEYINKNSERFIDIEKSLKESTNSQNKIKTLRDKFLGNNVNFETVYENKRETIQKAIILLKEIEFNTISINKNSHNLKQSKIKMSSCEDFVKTSTKILEEYRENIKSLEFELTYPSLDKIQLRNLMETCSETLHLTSSLSVHIENNNEKEKELEILTSKGKSQNKNLVELNKSIDTLCADYSSVLLPAEDLKIIINKKLEESALKKGSLEEKKKSFIDLDEKIKKDNLKINEISGKVSELTLQIKSNKAEKSLKDLELSNTFKQIEHQELELAIHRCRVELLKDNHCPVCDQKSSPNQEIDLSNHTNSKEIFQNTIAELQKGILALEKVIEKSNTNLDHYKAQISDIKSTIKSNEDSKTEILVFLEKSVEQDKSEKAKNDLLRVEDILSNINLIQAQLSEDRKDYAQKGQQIVKLKEQIKVSKSIIQKKNEEIINTLKIDEVEHSKVVELIKNEILILEKVEIKLRDEKQLEKDINTKSIEKKALKEQIEELNRENKKLDNEKITLVSKLKDDYKNKSPDELNNSLESLDKEKKSYLNQKEVHDKELQLINTKINQQQSQKGLLEEQIKELKNQLNSSFKNVQSSIINDSENLELNKFCSNLKMLENSNSYLNQISEISTSLDAILKPLYSNCSENSNSMHSKSIELKTKINSFKEKKKAQTEDKNELFILCKELERLQNLALLLGKDEFRNFALGLIEEQLIEQTNLELNSLCDGRYELEQVESSKGHEFYIIDHHKGSLKRKVKTLSGGETFLVSLAMALSLAELTRGKAEIDSFFIDEGFGSLDQDAIEEALEILLSIRNRGKQIGVISHIKALTSRIPINIHLEKSQNGESKISFLYN